MQVHLQRTLLEGRMLLLSFDLVGVQQGRLNSDNDNHVRCHSQPLRGPCKLI